MNHIHNEGSLQTELRGLINQLNQWLDEYNAFVSTTNSAIAAIDTTLDLSSVMITSVSDDFDIVYDDAGNIVMAG